MAKSALPKNSRPYLAAQYNAARSNLLLVAAFSFINLFLLVINASVYFLFSATFPYYLPIFGNAFAEVYDIPALYSISLGISVLVIAFYLLCWILSKKKGGWLLTAAILFGIDCLMLLCILIFFGFELSSLLDLLFHAWVMFSLCRGFSCYRKLSRMPEEGPVVPLNYNGPDIQDTSAILRDSVPLHPADVMAASVTLLEAVHAGLSVQIRRLGTMTEMVVNNMVYAEQADPLPEALCWDIQVCRVPFRFILQNGHMVLFSADTLLAETPASPSDPA